MSKEQTANMNRSIQIFSLTWGAAIRHEQHFLRCSGLQNNIVSLCAQKAIVGAFTGDLSFMELSVFNSQGFLHACVPPEDSGQPTGTHRQAY